MLESNNSDAAPTEQQTSSWKFFAKNKTVAHFLSESPAIGPVVTVDITSTISQLLFVLNSNNILSIPVVKDNEIVCIVDLVDVVGFIITYWRKKSSVSSLEFFPAEEIFLAPVKLLVEFCKYNPLLTIFAEQSLYEMMHELCKQFSWNKTHRILVSDSSGSILAMVSRTDIIHYVWKNVNMLPTELIQKTISDLRLFKATFSIRADSRLIDGLSVLYYNRISGVALVDPDYHLCGCLSVSDLRGVDVTSSNFFTGSVLNFLVNATPGLKNVLWCREDTTLYEILRLLVENNRPRIFVVDENHHPIGIITLCDIVQNFL
eukprot:TRINITY_DN4147_c0_g1_i1.p1 TRINITY_DN4147_c0_g1~~TRINITY_DN4147_c0_g1_i1.p1  ORF type:complete len:318 (+),score=35.65 TRINITY_DN4147_c0_g1_i1:120-1073(+)